MQDLRLLLHQDRPQGEWSTMVGEPLSAASRSRRWGPGFASLTCSRWGCCWRWRASTERGCVVDVPRSSIYRHISHVSSLVHLLLIYMCKTQIFNSKLYLWYDVRFIRGRNNLVLKVYRHIGEVSIFITQHKIQFVLQKVYLLCDFFWEQDASFMLGKYSLKSKLQDGSVEVIIDLA